MMQSCASGGEAPRKQAHSVLHGKNAYVARRHLAMPACTDYWINDSSDDPLLVIAEEVDAALTTATPRLLREVREVVGER
jgi:hypothetical protein